MFGTDLPSTRARHPFNDRDIDLITEVVGERGAQKLLWENARTFYRLAAGVVSAETGYTQ
jgi:predicted TIM-barrel fold metal-dependent hydrolase